MAIILVMMGSWLFSQYYNYDHVASDKSTLIPSCLTTTVGFLLLLVGILGFVVTYKANICLTRLVWYFLIVCYLPIPVIQMASSLSTFKRLYVLLLRLLFQY